MFEAAAINIAQPKSKEEEQREQREQQKEYLMGYLYRQCVYEEREGVNVWDLDGLKIMDLDPKYLKLSKTKQQNRMEVFDLLSDEKGLSKEDFDAGQRESKPLFYMPENREEAFDIMDIKENQAYLNFWDIWRQYYKGWNATITLPSGEDVSASELFISRTVFHDLNGKRNRAGDLMVDFDGQNKKFNASMLYQEFGFRGGHIGPDDVSFTSPVEYLIKKSPQLLKSGLLRLDDFNTLEEKSGKLIRKERQIPKTGVVYFNGAMYSLGKDFDTRKRPELVGKFSVTELSPSLAAVLEEDSLGVKHVTHTFKIKSEEEKLKKEEEVKKRHEAGEIAKGKKLGSAKRYMVFGRSEVELLPYLTTEDNKKFDDESDENYAERIRLISDYNSITQLSNEFASRAQIGLHDKLSWKEQQWLTTAVSRLRGAKDRIIDSSKAFGIDFLKTFLSCEYDIKQGEVILSIAENLEEDEALKIFQKYGEIINATEALEEWIKSEFINNQDVSESDVNEIAASLSARAKDLLVAFSLDKNIDETNVVDRLDQIKTNIWLFTESFRVVKPEFKEVKNSELITAITAELSHDEKSQMLAIAKKNWAEHQDVAKEVYADFEKFLETDIESKFSIYRKDGKIISFVRFSDVLDDKGEQVPGRKYAGSFNVNTDYRGSKIGSAMMDVSLKEEAQTNVLEATVHPELEVASNYIENIGFVIVGMVDDYNGTGQPFYKIECDLKKLKEYQSRDLTLSEIIKQSRKDQSGNIQAFVFSETASAIEKTQSMIDQGFVMTRYIIDPKNSEKRYYVFEKSK